MATLIASTGATPIRGSGVDTSAVTLGWTPTVGNVLVASIGTWKSPATTFVAPGEVRDTYTNTWTLGVEAPANANARASILYCVVGSTGGTFTVTADGDGSGIYYEWCVEEWDDLDTGALFVTSGTATGTSGAASVTTSGSSAVAGDLVIGVVAVNGDSDVSMVTPSGYTRTAYNPAASATVGFESVYRELSSGGAQTTTWGHDSSTWSAANLILKGTGFVPPTAPTGRGLLLGVG